MGRAFEGEVGPFEFCDQRDWRISYDTQLTLATCEAIIELSGGWILNTCCSPLPRYFLSDCSLR